MATKTQTIEVKVDERLAYPPPKAPRSGRLRGVRDCGQGGARVACDGLLRRQEARLRHFRGSEDRRGKRLTARAQEEGQNPT